jgi:hypothetical protein
LTSKHLEDFYFVEIVMVPNRNFIQKGERYISSMPLGFGYPVGTKAKEKTRIGSAFSSFVRDASHYHKGSITDSLLSRC